MNRYLLVISLILITCSGCEKEPPIYNKEDLFGKWQMNFVEYQHKLLQDKKRITKSFYLRDGWIIEFSENGTGYEYFSVDPQTDTIPITWDLFNNKLTFNLISIYGPDTSVSTQTFTVLYLTEYEFVMDYMLGIEDSKPLSVSYYRPLKFVHHFRKIE